MNPLLCWLIFTVTYCGIAVGGIPGLTIDRTGIALLGAIAMVVAGVLPLKSAMGAIDAPTLLLLFGLMLVSAQLRLSGFYTRTAGTLGGLTSQPKKFLLLLMAVSGALSAVLVNDIVCLAFTPVLTAAVLRARLNPMPYLIGLACSSNIGSAATLIGNPQNMLIGQVGKLDFGHFLRWCCAPSLLALAAAYGILLWIYRGKLGVRKEELGVGDHPPTHEPRILNPEPRTQTPESPADRWPMWKGLLVACAVMALFFTRVPRELTALTAGGVLLCSRRMDARRLLGLIDWSLIMLFCGLFVVIAGLETTGAPERLLAWLAGQGVAMADPFALTAVGALLSNLVSNVPAVMLLVRFLDGAPAESWYVLALASTFAGNLITIGSIANLIVIEQARGFGVKLSFREHARAGIPVTVVSLGLVVAWLLATRV
jgi:Na+/H+ antiporter NhaD/arsenite permease-like protein